MTASVLPVSTLIDHILPSYLLTGDAKCLLYPSGSTLILGPTLWSLGSVRSGPQAQERAKRRRPKPIMLLAYPMSFGRRTSQVRCHWKNSLISDDMSSVPLDLLQAMQVHLVSTLYAVALLHLVDGTSFISSSSKRVHIPPSIHLLFVSISQALVTSLDFISPMLHQPTLAHSLLCCSASCEVIPCWVQIFHLGSTKKFYTYKDYLISVNTVKIGPMLIGTV